MFIIKKVYENDLTALLKIEGEINDLVLEDWAEVLASLLRQANKHVILDCCDVSFVSLKVAERLIEQMTDKIFLLNCPTTVQNLVHARAFQSRCWSNRWKENKLCNTRKIKLARL